MGAGVFVGDGKFVCLCIFSVSVPLKTYVR